MYQRAYATDVALCFKPLYAAATLGEAAFETLPAVSLTTAAAGQSRLQAPVAALPSAVTSRAVASSTATSTQGPAAQQTGTGVSL